MRPGRTSEASLTTYEVDCRVIAIIAELLLTIRLRMAYLPLSIELSKRFVIKPLYKSPDLPPLTWYAFAFQLRVRYCGVVRTHRD